MIALGIFSTLCIPYFYQAITLNIVAHDDPNKGSHEYAKYSDLWIVLAGSLVCNVWERASEKITFPFFESITKGDGDEEMKKFYTKKACRTFW